jgi:hypothetical protein
MGRLSGDVRVKDILGYIRETFDSKADTDNISSKGAEIHFRLDNNPSLSVYISVNRRSADGADNSPGNTETVVYAVDNEPYRRVVEAVVKYFGGVFSTGIKDPSVKDFVDALYAPSGCAPQISSIEKALQKLVDAEEEAIDTHNVVDFLMKNLNAIAALAAGLGEGQGEE